MQEHSLEKFFKIDNLEGAASPVNQVQNYPWLRLGEPALVLAPMEGITDSPMRALLTEVGSFDLCVSEFIRVTQQVPPRRVFLRDVPELGALGVTPSGVPVQVQILGSHPENMAMAALQAIAAGARAIDINFGCPAKTVNRHDGGASLLRTPARVEEVVRAVREAVPSHIAVSAKIRLGWDCEEDVFENVSRAQAGGAAWVTIHARTRMQGYRPPANWELLGRVRTQMQVPLVANGDIWTLEDFRRCREVSGCEHFMLGRSAVVDPMLSRKVFKELGGREQGGTSTDWISLFIRFVSLCRLEDRSDRFLVHRMKQWLRMAEQRKQIDWFDTIKRIESLDELLQVIRVSLASERGL